MSPELRSALINLRKRPLEKLKLPVLVAADTHGQSTTAALIDCSSYTAGVFNVATA